MARPSQSQPNPAQILFNYLPSPSTSSSKPRSIPRFSARREMPADRSRSSNPQGRQKSCAECAKAKRRCDLRQPCCLRCSKQSLRCIYPSVPSHESGSNSQDEMVHPASVSDEDLFQLDVPSVPDVNVLEFDFSNVADSIESLNDLLGGDDEDHMDLAPIPPSTNYLTGKQFTAAQISPFAKSRVEYSMNQLKLIPEMIVKENKTPWIHSHLYVDDMPRCLQDAQAACALYTSRNDVNAAVVARHVTERLKELIHTPIPSNPVQLLARAHALLLYQIIFFFSDDILYHGFAEPTTKALEDVGYALFPVLQAEEDTSEPLLLYPSATALDAWKKYIFRESGRRTLLALFHLIALCNLFRGWLSTCKKEHVLGNRVTFSAHLWKASSAFDFALAWNEKNHFLIKELDFTNLLAAGRPDDIDVFGKMMLTGVMGIDDVKGWFHTRGGQL